MEGRESMQCRCLNTLARRLGGGCGAGCGVGSGVGCAARISLIDRALVWVLRVLWAPAGLYARVRMHARVCACVRACIRGIPHNTHNTHNTCRAIIELAKVDPTPHPTPDPVTAGSGRRGAVVLFQGGTRWRRSMSLASHTLSHLAIVGARIARPAASVASETSGRPAGGCEIESSATAATRASPRTAACRFLEGVEFVARVGPFNLYSFRLPRPRPQPNFSAREFRGGGISRTGVLGAERATARRLGSSGSLLTACAVSQEISHAHRAAF